jgi:hypothetical protein
LKIINKRLAKIEPIYKKNEYVYNMISHIFTNLPQKLYMDDVATMRLVIAGLQKYGQKKVVSELKEKWKRDIKSGDDVKDT